MLCWERKGCRKSSKGRAVSGKLSLSWEGPEIKCLVAGSQRVFRGKVSHPSSVR